MLVCSFNVIILLFVFVACERVCAYVCVSIVGKTTYNIIKCVHYFVKVDTDKLLHCYPFIDVCRKYVILKTSCKPL